MSHYITTQSGKKIDFANPDPNQIVIEDIAGALSKLCRFNGQINEFYSVAQHSMYVANMVPDHMKLDALLHDAPEAYLCDVPTPLKLALGAAYTDIEARVARAISAALAVEIVDLRPAIKAADRAMVVTEREMFRTVQEDWGPDYENSIRYPNFSPAYNEDWRVTNREFLQAYERYKLMPI